MNNQAILMHNKGSVSTSPVVPSNGIGLNFDSSDLLRWQQRAGVVSGERKYVAFGDAFKNSPDEWSRILGEAIGATNNSANDRYENYDTTQTLNNPILHLEEALRRGLNRTTTVDNKEPRPLISGRDWHAGSLMHAGLVYQIIGGDSGIISGKTGTDFANAVRTELLHYTTDVWLDFTNRDRWTLTRVSGQPNQIMYASNPGFFISCWLNTLCTAYDFVRGSSVFSSSDHDTIEQWFKDAMEFFHEMMILIGELRFTNYRNYDYTSYVFDNSNHTVNLGNAWDGSPYVSYGLNEGWANRSVAMRRFTMRCGIMLKDSTTHGAYARQIVRDSHQWFKECIAYGFFIDGTYSDFHRGKGVTSGTRTQIGLTYTGITIGCMIDIADAYDRNWSGEPDFESLYDWKLTRGTADYNAFFPANTAGQPWRGTTNFDPPEGQPRGLYECVRIHSEYYAGIYASTRKRGAFPIIGFYEPTGFELGMDIYAALANRHYNDPFLKEVYERTYPGMRDHKVPIRAGQYLAYEGAWGGTPGVLFQYAE